MEEKNDIKNKKNSFKVWGTILLIVISLILLFLNKDKILIETNINLKTIKNSKTIQGKKLVIKSKTDYNKIIEYVFESNILNRVLIHEEFQERDKYEETKNSYNIQNNIDIIEFNDNNLSIDIEKKDFGSDSGLTYDQIYDKYLIQIIDAYELIN